MSLRVAALKLGMGYISHPHMQTLKCEAVELVLQVLLDGDDPDDDPAIPKPDERRESVEVRTGQRRSDGNLSFFSTGADQAAAHVAREPIVLRLESMYTSWLCRYTPL